jgi:hypothetical protein
MDTHQAKQREQAEMYEARLREGEEARCQLEASLSLAQRAAEDRHLLNQQVSPGV